MTSFIIISQDKKKRQDYIKNYCQQLGINSLDITVIEKETAVKANAQSIGIDEIKLMQKKLFFKPIKSPTKAVVLEDAQLLTTEAQNSMLKILEEPPDNTIIILSAETIEAFLPTIISRCKIIELETQMQKISEKELSELKEFILNLSKMPVGEKFQKAETLAKDKEKALAWIEKIILVLRGEMLREAGEPSAINKLQAIKSFQKLFKIIKTTNANPRFAIESTFLQL